MLALLLAASLSLGLGGTASDGLGEQVQWKYSPLSGKAGRGAGVTPLYSVPTDPAQRYIDERHIYFTSSMPVVVPLLLGRGHALVWVDRFARGVGGVLTRVLFSVAAVCIGVVLLSESRMPVGI